MANRKVKLGKYLVSIEGKNFLVKVDSGRAWKHGFFTSVAVEGIDEKDAYQRTVLLLRDDVSLKSLVKNKPDDRPSLLLLHVQKLRSFRLHRQGLNPLVWYKETIKKPSQ